MPGQRDVLRVESVEVREDLVVARVRIADEALVRTSGSEGLPERCFDLLPGLRRHTCSNHAGRTFADELADTETAHLFEHVVCELMALAGSPRHLRGLTSWDFARDGRGVFSVQVQFDDDLVALGALKSATPVVSWLVLGQGARPDVETLAERLLAVRRS